MGFFMKAINNNQNQTQGPNPPSFRAGGDGFWKGCCAALSCCSVPDPDSGEQVNEVGPRPCDTVFPFY